MINTFVLPFHTQFYVSINNSSNPVDDVTRQFQSTIIISPLDSSSHKELLPLNSCHAGAKSLVMRLAGAHSPAIVVCPILDVRSSASCSENAHTAVTINGSHPDTLIAIDWTLISAAR